MSETLHEDLERVQKMIMAERSQEIERLNKQLHASHRCWPSRLGWACSLALLIYVLLLQSSWSYYKQTLQSQVDSLKVELQTVQSRLLLFQTSLDASLQKPPPSLPWWLRRRRVL